MYRIKKTFEISAAHRLTTSYETPCNRVHGHNWIVTVYCQARELDGNGMVIDFSHIKRIVKEKLDHRMLNDVLPQGMNPTAENIARWICEQVPHCYRVDVAETANNVAVYEKDE